MSSYFLEELRKARIALAEQRERMKQTVLELARHRTEGKGAHGWVRPIKKPEETR